MPTTSGNLRYPASTDAVDVPGDIKKLADDVDTYKAPKASPDLTGTPTAPTAAADTDTTQIATTAYVIGQASSSNGAALGVAAAGTSKKYARADHVHSSTVANPTFTGQVIVPAGDATAPGIVPTGDTNTGLFAPAADTLAISTGGSERLRVNASGNVGIGVSPGNDFDVQRSSQLISRWRSAVDSNRGSLLYFDKARGSWSAPTAVQNGDSTLEIFSRAHDGTQVRDVGAIQILVDGTVATNDVPSRLTLSTRPAGVAAAVTERMRIDSNGLITGTGTSLGAWTAYTPTWGGNTTNPAIGNGTLTGAYCQIGKMVFGRVKIVAGSTTTFGSGAYYISMPVTAKSSDQPVGHGYLVDSSAGTRYLVLLTPASTTNLWVRYSANPVDTNATTPMTWADSDNLLVSFVYEAA